MGIDWFKNMKNFVLSLLLLLLLLLLFYPWAIVFLRYTFEDSGLPFGFCTSCSNKHKQTPHNPNNPNTITMHKVNVLPSTAVYYIRTSALLFDTFSDYVLSCMQ